MTPDHFVVQIYHRRGEGTDEIAGVVERVGSGNKQSFKSAQELWTLLTAQTNGQRGRKKN